MSFFSLQFRISVSETKLNFSTQNFENWKCVGTLFYWNFNENVIIFLQLMFFISMLVLSNERICVQMQIFNLELSHLIELSLLPASIAFDSLYITVSLKSFKLNLKKYLTILKNYWFDYIFGVFMPLLSSSRVIDIYNIRIKWYNIYCMIGK